MFRGDLTAFHNYEMKKLNLMICAAIKQNDSEVGSDMLLVSNYFILQTMRL